MYIHVHTYMDCIHTHPYIYTCIYVCIYMYGCIYICVCVCIYIRTCIAGPAAGQPPTIHGLASAEGGMHVHIQTYTYTRIQPYTPTYMLCSVLQWVVCRRNSQSTTGSDQNATASQTQCEVHIQSGWLAGKLFNKLLHITYGQI